jgi:hypothetical protein
VPPDTETGTMRVPVFGRFSTASYLVGGAGVAFLEKGAACFQGSAMSDGDEGPCSWFACCVFAVLWLSPGGCEGGISVAGSIEASVSAGGVNASRVP